MASTHRLGFTGRNSEPHPHRPLRPVTDLDHHCRRARRSHPPRSRRTRPRTHHPRRQPRPTTRPAGPAPDVRHPRLPRLIRTRQSAPRPLVAKRRKNELRQLDPAVRAAPSQSPRPRLEPPPVPRPDTDDHPPRPHHPHRTPPTPETSSMNRSDNCLLPPPTAADLPRQHRSPGRQAHLGGTAPPGCHVVRPSPRHQVAGRRIFGSPDRRVVGSPDRQIAESSDRQIARSPDRQISESPDLHVARSPSHRSPSHQISEPPDLRMATSRGVIHLPGGQAATSPSDQPARLHRDRLLPADGTLVHRVQPRRGG